MSAVRTSSVRPAGTTPQSSDRLTLSARARTTVMVIPFVGSCVALVWSMSDPQGQFFLFGMLACLVVTIPITRPGYAVLGPWSLLAVLVYVSCGLRGLFIALDLDGRLSIDALFLLGHGPGYFTRASALYVVALAVMAAGYTWHPRRVPGAVIRRIQELRFPPLTGMVIVVLALVGFGAFVMYAQRTGGLSAGLSMKRTTINGLELSSTYESHGELRFVNTFSSIAFWLHVACHAVRKGSAGLGARVMGFALAANAVLLPVYASARSDVAYIALVAFVIHYGVAGRLPRGRTVLRWALMGLLVLAVMTGARLASQGSDRASDDKQQALTDAVGEVLVYNRNFGDMQTTAHIIHAVPNLLPLQHGKTMTVWLTAPIPRAIWPEKPLVQSGPIIGATVYGNPRSGVPPGFVAEMYWNFAVPGVLIGSLLLGLALAWLREAFVPYLRDNPGVALLYGVVVMRIGGFVVSNGVGSGIFNLSTDLSCLVVALALIRLLGSGPARTRPPTAQRQHDVASV